MGFFFFFFLLNTWSHVVLWSDWESHGPKDSEKTGLKDTYIWLHIDNATLSCIWWMPCLFISLIQLQASSLLFQGIRCSYFKTFRKANSCWSSKYRSSGSNDEALFATYSNWEASTFMWIRLQIVGKCEYSMQGIWYMYIINTIVSLYWVPKHYNVLTP